MGRERSEARGPVHHGLDAGRLIPDVPVHEHAVHLGEGFVGFETQAIRRRAQDHAPEHLAGLGGLLLLGHGSAVDEKLHDARCQDQANASHSAIGCMCQTPAVVCRPVNGSLRSKRVSEPLHPFSRSASVIRHGMEGPAHGALECDRRVAQDQHDGRLMALGDMVLAHERRLLRQRRGQAADHARAQAQ